MVNGETVLLITSYLLLHYINILHLAISQTKKFHCMLIRALQALFGSYTCMSHRNLKG